jgi:hypothetical protein
MSFVLVKAAPSGWLHFCHIPLRTKTCHWQVLAREASRIFDPAAGPPNNGVLETYLCVLMFSLEAIFGGKFGGFKSRLENPTP